MRVSASSPVRIGPLGSLPVGVTADSDEERVADVSVTVAGGGVAAVWAHALRAKVASKA
ncbi:hypothetical protein XFF6970_770004 [Xanthomonas citri pv. fuscans]|nr:hypothetical protein XFF6970_770004 [Xanthomonas citri pv. fuscans]